MYITTSGFLKERTNFGGALCFAQTPTRAQDVDRLIFNYCARLTPHDN
jgi:hypothetical protein